MAAATVVLIGVLIGIFRMAVTVGEDDRLQAVWQTMLVLVVLVVAGYVAYTLRGHLRRVHTLNDASRE